MNRLKLICWAPELLAERSADPSRPAAIELWAEASVSARQLDLRYTVRYPSGADAVVVPQPPRGDGDGPPLPQRCDGLWQHTCFEAFLAAEGCSEYWEFNLSPSGDWNVYRFEAYRSGQQPDLAYSELPAVVMGPRSAPPCGPCSSSPPAALLEVGVRCALPQPLQQASALQLGLTAVLEQGKGELSYWALHHPAAEPDFHDRRGWTARR